MFFYVRSPKYKKKQNKTKPKLTAIALYEFCQRQAPEQWLESKTAEKTAPGRSN